MINRHKDLTGTDTAPISIISGHINPNTNILYLYFFTQIYILGVILGSYIGCHVLRRMFYIILFGGNMIYDKRKV